MTDSPVLPEFSPPSSPGKRQYIAPAIFALVILLVLGAVIVLAQRSGGSGAPPRPGAFVTPVDPRPFVVYSVQQASEGSVTFGSGDGQQVSDLAIDANTRIEVLTIAPFDSIAVGDWVTLIGVPNGVRTFALRGIVVLPEPGTERVTGFATTPGGFLGHEVSRDPAEQPAVGGIVTAVGEDSLTLDAPDGRTDITVSLDAENPPPVVQRVEQGSLEDLRAGASVAFPAEDGRPAPGFDAVLVTLP